MLKISFLFEARKPWLFANLNIWGMADLRKPCVLPSTGLNKDFCFLVTGTLLASVLTNQFLNFVLLIQSLVNFSFFCFVLSWKTYLPHGEPRKMTKTFLCTPDTNQFWGPILSDLILDLLLVYYRLGLQIGGQLILGHVVHLATIVHWQQELLTSSQPTIFNKKFY